MPAVDLIDETFIVAAPSVLAVIVHDPNRWRQWWPDLALTVFMDRGDQGVRWSVSRPLVGSAEIWLEPMGDGTLVHYFLRVDLAGGRPISARRAAGIRRQRALDWKCWINALKDEFEVGRLVGCPRPDSRNPADLPTIGE